MTNNVKDFAKAEAGMKSLEAAMRVQRAKRPQAAISQAVAWLVFGFARLAQSVISAQAKKTKQG